MKISEKIGTEKIANRQLEESMNASEQKKITDLFFEKMSNRKTDGFKALCISTTIYDWRLFEKKRTQFENTGSINKIIISLGNLKI